MNRYVPFSIFAAIVGSCHLAFAEGSRPLQGPIRVQSQLRFDIPASTQNSTEDLKAMEAARNQLYELAGRECQTLQQTFAADCRLTGLTIDSSITGHGGTDHSVALSVQNSYELKPKP